MQTLQINLNITKPSNFVLKLCCVKENLLLQKIVLILFFRSDVWIVIPSVKTIVYFFYVLFHPNGR